MILFKLDKQDEDQYNVTCNGEDIGVFAKFDSWRFIPSNYYFDLRDLVELTSHAMALNGPEASQKSFSREGTHHTGIKIWHLSRRQHQAPLPYSKHSW